MTTPTVRVGDTLHLGDDIFHVVTTEGELGFADYLVRNGKATVVQNTPSPPTKLHGYYDEESGETYYVVEGKKPVDTD